MGQHPPATRLPLSQLSPAADYPGHYERGSLIEGLDAAAAVKGVEIFHADTKADGLHVLANGGWVLNVCALVKSMRQAQSRAYEAIARQTRTY